VYICTGDAAEVIGLHDDENQTQIAVGELM
jgi:hypothetical protein